MLTPVAFRLQAEDHVREVRRYLGVSFTAHSTGTFVGR